MPDPQLLDQVVAGEQAIAELAADEARVLRETETGVTDELRRQLIDIRADRELHTQRLDYLAGRIVEVERESLQADATTLFAELGERQIKAIARAEGALQPAGWTRLVKGLDGVVKGLKGLQEAHVLLGNRQALGRAFELEDEVLDEEEPSPIADVAPLELGVREQLMKLRGQIDAVFGECDITARMSCGLIPLHVSTDVAELLERLEADELEGDELAAR